MKDKSFKEKWQDKKYQAKVKLSGYGIFIFAVILIILFGQSSSNINNFEDDLDSVENKNVDNAIYFAKPTVNNYTYTIEIVTEKLGVVEEVSYYGRVLDSYEELVKNIRDKEYNYKFLNNKYYILNGEDYILTTKGEVYDILDYNYLNVDNINNYLSYAKNVDNLYQVYLKDIILDNNTDDYITIKLSKENININYTNLINYLTNEQYNEYIVNISYDY